MFFRTFTTLMAAAIAVSAAPIYTTPYTNGTAVAGAASVGAATTGATSADAASLDAAASVGIESAGASTSISTESAVAASKSTFNTKAGNLVAAYWGQGGEENGSKLEQERLSHYCAQDIDIFMVSFVTQFPNKGKGGMFENDYGNQCSSTLYKGTNIHTGCDSIAADIPTCQAKGKKILASLGGGGAKQNYRFASDKEAETAAQQIWDAYGPKKAGYTGPRPFGAAVVDGFDFDVEINGATGYAAMAKKLRALFAEDNSKTYYLSAAPQCPDPDKQLSPALTQADFDFVWPQFYNNDGCAAVNAIGSKTLKGKWNWATWAGYDFSNKDARVFIGLPASTHAADSKYFATAADLKTLVATAKKSKNFGGIMLWDAIEADGTYATAAKSAMG